jgi:hypothetical protein
MWGWGMEEHNICGQFMSNIAFCCDTPKSLKTYEKEHFMKNVWRRKRIFISFYRNTYFLSNMCSKKGRSSLTLSRQILIKHRQPSFFLSCVSKVWTNLSQFNASDILPLAKICYFRVEQCIFCVCFLYEDSFIVQKLFIVYLCVKSISLYNYVFKIRAYIDFRLCYLVFRRNQRCVLTIRLI